MHHTFKNIKEYLLDHKISIKTDVDDKLEIFDLRSLSSASINTLTFYSDDKLINELKFTKATACLVKEENSNLLPLNCLPIIVNDPYLAFAHLTHFFYSNLYLNKIENPSTNKYKNSLVKSNSFIHKNVIINENTTLGNNVTINSNTVIGPNVNIEDNTIIYSNCSISNSAIGKNCLIQSGTVIGDRGFGFTPVDKIELIHIGRVKIGNNVHIGSNCTIDKALLDFTVIEENVRIDNLVHLAHGVFIGNGTIIAAQVGIAGSAVIGKNCLIGGQAGIAGHISIGNNVRIAAKSGVTKNIKDNSTISGFPAIDIKLWKKNIINRRKK